MAALRGSRFERVGTVFTLMTRAAPHLLGRHAAADIFRLPVEAAAISLASVPPMVRYRWETEWDKLLSPVFWRHMILPTFTLALYLHGLPLLLMRSNMLEVLDQDYVTMSRLAGYSEWRVMIQTAARNAMLPVLDGADPGHRLQHRRQRRHRACLLVARFGADAGAGGPASRLSAGAGRFLFDCGHHCVYEFHRRYFVQPAGSARGRVGAGAGFLRRRRGDAAGSHAFAARHLADRPRRNSGRARPCANCGRPTWKSSSATSMALFGLNASSPFSRWSRCSRPILAPNDPAHAAEKQRWRLDQRRLALLAGGTRRGRSRGLYQQLSGWARPISAATSISQLIHGSRSALLVGFSAAAAVAVIGTVVGLLAGYYGGWVDIAL